MRTAFTLLVVSAVLVAGCGDDSRPQLPVGAGGASTEAAVADTSMARAVDYRMEADTAGLPDEGPAYEVDGDVSEESVTKLARALGLDGAARPHGDGAWLVSEGDALLTVDTVGAGAWYFQASGACPPDTPVSSDGSGGCRAPEVAASPPVEEPLAGEGEPQRPAGLPSRDEAEQVARRFLEAVPGYVETAAARVEDGFSAWYVSLEPEVDGLPTAGYGWTVTVGPDGVQSASGHLGTAERVASYPLVAARDAVDRIMGAGRPEPAVEPAVDCPPDAEVCAQPMPAEPEVRTITSVRLGLLYVVGFAEREQAYLVPAWFLTTDDGHELPVVAVADEYLQQPEEPAPVEPDGGGRGESEPGSPGIEVRPDTPESDR